MRRKTIEKHFTTNRIWKEIRNLGCTPSSCTEEFNKSRVESPYYPYQVSVLGTSIHGSHWQHLNPSQSLRSFLTYLGNTKLSSASFFLYRSSYRVRGKCPFRSCLFSALVGENFAILYVHAFLLPTPKSMLGKQNDPVKRALD